MSSIKDILVPDIGEFDAVEVIEVLVKSGDAVSVEDALLTMESDKASMDVPSPFSGTVKTVKLKAGDKVSQNDLILTLVVKELETAVTETSAETENSEATAPETKDIVSTIESESTSSGAVSKEPARRPPPIVMSVNQKSFLRAHASPSIRKFARELGVDLSQVHGSGRKERITKEDVQEFVKQALGGTASGTAAAGSGIPAMPEIDFSKFGPVEIKPLSRIQKKAAVNLHRGWLNLPIVTHHDEADITELEYFRKSLKDKSFIDSNSSCFFTQSMCCGNSEASKFQLILDCRQGEFSVEEISSHWSGSGYSGRPGGSCDKGCGTERFAGTGQRTR